MTTLSTQQTQPHKHSNINQDINSNQQQPPKTENPLANYRILQTFPTHLLLEDSQTGLTSIYKEFSIPSDLEFKIFYNELLNRRKIQNQNLLALQMFLFDVATLNKPDKNQKFGLLFENYLRDFQSELTNRLNTNNFWTEEELMNTLDAVLLGLNDLHRIGIVHGDISAAYIVFCEDGFVKLADQFSRQRCYKVAFQDLKNQGTSYISPELMIGKVQQFDKESDLYALGMTFLEAATLKSSRELYLALGGINQINLKDRLNFVKQNYSQQFSQILGILLHNNPRERRQIYNLFTTENNNGIVSAQQTSVISINPISHDNNNCQEVLFTLQQGNQSYTQQEGNKIIDRTLEEQENIYPEKSRVNEIQQHAKPEFKSSKCLKLVQQQQIQTPLKEIDQNQPSQILQQQQQHQQKAEQVIRESNIKLNNSRLQLTQEKIKKMDEIVKKSSMLVEQIKNDFGIKEGHKSGNPEIQNKLEQLQILNEQVQQIDEVPNEKQKNSQCKVEDIIIQNFEINQNVLPTQSSFKDVSTPDINLSVCNVSSDQQMNVQLSQQSNQNASDTLKKKQSTLNNMIEECLNKSRLILQQNTNSQVNQQLKSAKGKSNQKLEQLASDQSQVQQCGKVNNYQKPKQMITQPCDNNKQIVKDSLTINSINSTSSLNHQVNSQEEDLEEKILNTAKKYEDANETEPVSSYSGSKKLLEQFQNSLSRSRALIEKTQMQIKTTNNQLTIENSQTKFQVKGIPTSHHNKSQSSIQYTPSKNLLPQQNVRRDSMNTSFNQLQVKQETSSQLQQLNLIINYSNGDYYEGQQVNGLREGNGTLYSSQQFIIYQGDWKNDKYTGQGVLYNQEAEELNQNWDYKDFSKVFKYWIKYEGQFQDGMMHGAGYLFFQNKESFHGMFNRGVIHGKGSFVSKSGNIIAGEWQLNKMMISY